MYLVDGSNSLDGEIYSIYQSSIVTKEANNLLPWRVGVNRVFQSFKLKYWTVMENEG